MRKFLRKATALIAAAAVSLSAADFPCGFAGFGLDISASAEGECVHANVTDNVCTDCQTEMAAVLSTSYNVYTYFATVEEAVAEANRNEDIAYLYLIEDYTGDISLTRTDGNITVTSFGNTPVTLTGDITAENMCVLQLQNLTVNGDVTAGESVALYVYDGASVKTLTANYTLRFEGGSAETVNTYSFADFLSGTIGNVNDYCGISIYENTNITGVLTLAEGKYITIQENPLNTLTIKALLGAVASLGQNADPETLDLTKIVSADGYEVVLNENSEIAFVCSHASYTDGVCDKCEAECTHETVTDGVCGECESEFAAAVSPNEHDYIWFATVEEAVAEANSNENIGYLYLTEDYTGNIALTRTDGNITVSSFGNTPVTLTGNITAENMFVLHLKNLTLNGNATAGEKVSLCVYDGVSMKTLTANYQLEFIGGSAETVNTYSFANFSGGTMGNVNAYSGVSVYENTNITGVLTLAEGKRITIQRNPLNTLTVKAGFGSVASFGTNADPAAFDISKIVSADGYGVVLGEDNWIYFVCEHKNITDGVCSDCKNTYEALLITEGGTETYYEDIDNAVDDAEDGDTIKLLCDITLDESENSIDFVDVTITLDMNGYDITAECYVGLSAYNGDLTIKGGGSVTAENYAVAAENGSVIRLGGDAPALTGDGADVLLLSSYIVIEESVSVYNDDVYVIEYWDSEDNKTGVFAQVIGEADVDGLFSSYYGYDVYETYNAGNGRNICFGEFIDLTVNGVTYSCVASYEEIPSSFGENEWLAFAYPTTVYGYEGEGDDSFVILDGESKTAVLSNHTGDMITLNSDLIETISLAGENEIVVYILPSDEEDTSRYSVNITGDGSLTYFVASAADVTIDENVEIISGIAGEKGTVVTNNGTIRVPMPEFVSDYGGVEGGLTLKGDGEFIFTDHPDAYKDFKFADGAEFTYDGTDLTEKIKAMVVTDSSAVAEYMGIDWKLEADLSSWASLIIDGTAENDDIPVSPIDAGDYKLCLRRSETDYTCLDFTIDPADIAKAEVEAESEYVYNGDEYDLVIEYVYLCDDNLVEGADYTISGVTSAENAGKYTVYLEGMGNFTGKKEIVWEIKPFEADSFEWAIGIGKAYDGNTDFDSSECMDATVRFNDNDNGTSAYISLSEDAELEIKFDTPDAGNEKGYTVTITFTGEMAKNFTESTMSCHFDDATIYQKELDSVTIIPEKTEYDYTGEEIKPAVTVKDGEEIIPADHYEIDYIENINAGEATIEVRGVEGGNYCFFGSVSFTINKVKATVTAAPAAKELTYTGEAQVLVSGGTANGGSFMYSFTGEDGSFTADIPTGTKAGKYIVYYYVKGDDNHTDGESGSLTVEIGKAEPEYTIPEGITATYGDTLADVELPEGFAWADETMSVGNVGEYEFESVFTPEDTENYNISEGIAITVTVAKAKAEDVAVPTAADITTGVTLAASALSDTSWKWVDETIVPEVGTKGYEAYVKVDDANYDYSGIEGYNAENGTVTRLVQVTVKETAVSAFVERLYGELLGRKSDAKGKAKWVAQLESGKTAAQVASNFVLGEELKAQNLTNEEFVTRMYETMLDRTPSDSEIANWASYLDAGCTYAFVFRGFLSAPEFGRLCARYGIETGTYTATENRDVNGKLTKFISRLYTKALNRAYDAGGLNFHTGNYISGKYTLDKIASGFIFSAEFEKRNLSDERFVECMYNTFFDRTSDAKGKANWLQKMANGMTREEVFNGFVNSPEYKAFVKSAGI